MARFPFFSMLSSVMAIATVSARILTKYRPPNDRCPFPDENKPRPDAADLPDAKIGNIIADLDPADIVSQEDIDACPGGLPIIKQMDRYNRKGVVYLLEALTNPSCEADTAVDRCGTTGATPREKRCLCRVHLPSVVDVVIDSPPLPGKHKWMRLTIYDSPLGGIVCLKPLGGGCYMLIKAAPLPGGDP